MASLAPFLHQSLAGGYYRGKGGNHNLVAGFKEMKTLTWIAATTPGLAGARTLDCQRKIDLRGHIL